MSHTFIPTYSTQYPNYNGYPSPLPSPPTPATMIQVFSSASFEGEHGTPISVEVGYAALCDGMSADKVRISFGNQAVATQTEASGEGRMNLVAYAPSWAEAAGPSASFDASQVQLSVEALSPANMVLESVLFGTFQYLGIAPPPVLARSQKRRRGKTLPSQEPEAPRRRTRSRASTTVASTQRSPPPRSPRKPHAALSGRPILTRTDPSLGEGRKISLQVTTPLDTMASNWSTEDHANGRVLVRFHRTLKGDCLNLSAERITEEQWSEDDITVSCIYRQEDDTFWITSIDIIILVGRIINQDLDKDEGGRIRRNLEGLHPETVKRSNDDRGEFFQAVMDLPYPKPRNIEKVFKVFKWSTCALALEKIFAKYRLYDSVSGPSSPVSEIDELPPYVPSSPSSSYDQEMYTILSPMAEYLSPLDIAYSDHPYHQQQQQYLLPDNVVVPSDRHTGPSSSPFLQYAPSLSCYDSESSEGTYGSSGGYHTMESSMYTVAVPDYVSPQQMTGALPSSYYHYDSMGYPNQPPSYVGEYPVHV